MGRKRKRTISDDERFRRYMASEFPEEFIRTPKNKKPRLFEPDEITYEHGAANDGTNPYIQSTQFELAPNFFENPLTTSENRRRAFINYKIEKLNSRLLELVHNNPGNKNKNAIALIKMSIKREENKLY